MNMEAPFVLILLLAVKVENQEEITPGNGLPFPVELASRRPALTEIPRLA